MIPITDHLPIALRAYAQAPDAKKPHAGASSSEWTLTFDCETRTDAGQAFRFGAYQLHNGDRVYEAGLFYEPGELSENELATLRSFALRNQQKLRTRERFVNHVVFQLAYELRAKIVGFNLPFDISRLAIAHGTARLGMYGGFTFTLSDKKRWPHIRIKHISRRCALIDFAAPPRQRSSRGQRNRGLYTPVHRGHFVDVNTLAASLLSRSFTLGSLSKFLGVANPKLDFDAFDGPVADEMLTYAVRDVQTTWECHVALLEKLEKLGLGELQPEQIYSEASIGKGYLRKMGIAPWREVQPDFPPEMTGRILSTYFGGRSEVRIRRELRQVILCDFLSMYPTVCTLMGLWRFVIGGGMTWEDVTEETRDFLETVSLSDLQRPDMWKRLAVLVKVEASCDVFPVRAAYSGDAMATIGANYLTAEGPLWFTLSDCIASKLLTGKAPKVLEAIAFQPGPMQPDLCAIDVGGNPDYRVDPTSSDFFKRVIELRKAIQVRMHNATGIERETLDSQQHTFKICANSTSYGIWMQVNVAKLAKTRSCTINGHDGDPFAREVNKAEKPGEYFHPLLASLITGAARLMLAITERLIANKGLEWAFCDTDSMAIAKPEGMDDFSFGQRVQAIADWFAELNPYNFPGSILKIEGENAALATGKPEPLFCWAVSSKRYALFNLDGARHPVMRKVSAHGLGHLLPPYRQSDAPPNTPTPDESVVRSGVERWHCDLWFEIVSAALAGKPDMPQCDFHPAMQLPAISRYGASAPDMLRWFDHYNADRSYADQVKPFGFLLALHAKRKGKISANPERRGKRGRPPKPVEVKPVAPFDRDLSKASENAFDRESGLAVHRSQLETYAEAVSRYHLHPESKFLGADYFDRGTTTRRHIHVSGISYIGKEANELERQQFLGADADLAPDYGLADDMLGRIKDELEALTNAQGIAKTAKAMRITTQRLASILSGELSLDIETGRYLSVRLRAAQAQAEVLGAERRHDLKHICRKIEEMGLRGAARQLGVDPSNLRRKVKALVGLRITQC